MSQQPYQQPYGAPENYTPAGYPPPPPASRGCFFYGCIFAAVLAVLGILAVGAVFYAGYHYYSKMLVEYTSTAPATIPQVKLTDEQRKSLDERWAAFRKSVEEGKAAEVSLNSDELNTLVSENDKLKGKVYFTIKGDQVTGQVSIPLEGLPGAKGRFLNGSATLTGSILDGQLIVRAKELEVNGKSLPPNIKAQLASENLAKDFAKDPDNAEKIRKIENFTVKDGMILIKSRDMSQSKEEVPGTKEKANEPGAPPADPANAKSGVPTEKPSEPKVEAPKPAQDGPSTPVETPK